MPRFVRITLLGRMKLRAKLSSAFLFLSLLIGICGASGLAFLYGVGATLSVFADITSPLLGQTIVLADNAQRMRSVFLDAMNKSDNDAYMQASDKLRDLAVEAGQRMERLRHLLSRSDLPVRLDDIRQLQNEFTQGRILLLTAHRQQQIALLAEQDRLMQFEAERREFDSLLRTITARSEALMAKSRDQ